MSAASDAQNHSICLCYRFQLNYIKGDTRLSFTASFSSPPLILLNPRRKLSFAVAKYQALAITPTNW